MLVWLSPLVGVVCAVIHTCSVDRGRVREDCWHAQTDYDCAPTFGLTVHPDNWKWKETEHYAWREHEGQGYWKGKD
jgi:hypothetical protein